MPSSAAPRALPSFPTRRSSDLRARGGARPDRVPGSGAGRRRAGAPPPRRRGRARRRHRHGLLTARGPLRRRAAGARRTRAGRGARSEEHTSELQSRSDLVCRLLPPPELSPLSLHDALPISVPAAALDRIVSRAAERVDGARARRRRGVEVALDGGTAMVSLQLAARYGVVLPELAERVQAEV